MFFFFFWLVFLALVIQWKFISIPISAVEIPRICKSVVCHFFLSATISMEEWTESNSHQQRDQIGYLWSFIRYVAGNKLVIRRRYSLCILLFINSARHSSSLCCPHKRFYFSFKHSNIGSNLWVIDKKRPLCCTFIIALWN